MISKMLKKLLRFMKKDATKNELSFFKNWLEKFSKLKTKYRKEGK